MIVNLKRREIFGEENIDEIVFFSPRLEKIHSIVIVLCDAGSDVFRFICDRPY